MPRRGSPGAREMGMMARRTRKDEAVEGIEAVGATGATEGIEEAMAAEVARLEEMARETSEAAGETAEEVAGALGGEAAEEGAHDAAARRVAGIAGVSEAEARAALEASGWDALDALGLLESRGATARVTARVETGGAAPSQSPEMAEAQAQWQAASRTGRGGDALGRAWERAKGLLRSGWETRFVATHEGVSPIELPVIVLAIGLLAWGATIWLLVIGLFFGWRYRIDGLEPITVDVNDAMGRAADAAQGVRDGIGGAVDGLADHDGGDLPGGGAKA